LVITRAPTLGGILSPDIVDVVQGDVNFSQSNAGTDLGVTASGWDIDGTDAANYLAPESQPLFAGANILRRQLVWAIGSTLTPATVEDKIYNGNTTATVSGDPFRPTLGNVVPSDTITVSAGHANFAQSDAGTDITVTATGWGITGTGTANYLVPVTQPSFAPANIFARPLDALPRATVVVSNSYVFTGSAITPLSEDVTVNLSGFGNLRQGEDFDFTYAASNNINAGSDAIITVTGRGNFTGSISGTFAITPKPITGIINIDVTDTDDGRIVEDTILTANLAGVIGVPGPGGTEVTEADLLFEWIKNENGILTSLATGSNTYKIESIDIPGSKITLKVTGTGNYTETLESNPVTVGLISLGGKIGIISNSLSPTTEDILEIDWEELVTSGATYDIIWYRDGVQIADAVEEDYTVKQEDLGKTITVEVIGTGEYTGSLSAYIQISATPPNAPMNLTAAPGDKQVTLSWSEPDFDGGSDITNYHIFVSPDDGDSWLDAEQLFTPFSGMLFTPYSSELITPLSTGTSSPFATTSDTTITVNGLTNGNEYTFRVHAENDAGLSDHIEGTATPREPPIITSITPTPLTVSMFEIVPVEGISQDAVFYVVGTNLTEQVIMGEGVFSVSEFPAWVLPSNLLVEYIDIERAVITVTLTVRPNNEAERTGTININNTITGIITGTLTISQDTAEVETEVTGFTVTILNSPNGTASISGQSESVRVFEPGTQVSLTAGTRSGFTFNNWSSVSQGVALVSASSSYTSFVMPSNDVIIIANWSTRQQAPVDASPLTSQGDPPGSSSGSGLTSGSGTGSGTGSGSTITDPSGSNPGDSTGVGGESPTQDDSTASDATSRTGLGALLLRNLWWILLLLGFISVVSSWPIILWRKRITTEKASIATSGET